MGFLWAKEHSGAQHPDCIPSPTLCPDTGLSRWPGTAQSGQRISAKPHGAAFPPTICRPPVPKPSALPRSPALTQVTPRTTCHPLHSSATCQDRPISDQETHRPPCRMRVSSSSSAQCCDEILPFPSSLPVLSTVIKPSSPPFSPPVLSALMRPSPSYLLPSRAQCCDENPPPLSDLLRLSPSSSSAQ